MERMLLLLSRSPEQEAALRQLLEEQQDSSSANYRQWLTPEQFGDQFGAAPEDIDTITSWLSSQGFRVDRVSNGRGVIEFSGTAGEVERALHTQIHSYLVHGKQHWANSQEPRIPAALSPAVLESCRSTISLRAPCGTAPVRRRKKPAAPVDGCESQAAVHDEVV